MHKSAGKKVVILGTGNAQVDAIMHCKERGCEVHALSYRREGRGVPLADHFALVNIADKQGVADYAKRIAADVVYSVGSDIAMPTVGYVADQLGLPAFVSGPTADLLENKSRMRAFLHKQGLSPVAFAAGSTLTDFSGWTRFPAIIKPVDSQGQRGVFELESRDALKKCFAASKSFSRCGDVIVEEFIEGPEYSANVFVRDGDVANCFISDRKVVEGLPGGIVRGHEVPPHMSEAMQEKVRTLVSEIVSALQLENGPVYFQMRCTEEDVFIIEVTARLDGCHLWRLIKLKHGVDLLALSFDALLGAEASQAVAFPGQERPCALRLDFDLQEPGTLFSMESVDAGGALYKELYYQPGEKVRRINGYAEKVGYAIREV